MEKLFSNLSFWGKVSGDDKKLIINNAIRKSYKKQEIIYSPLKQCLGMVMVLDGIIKVSFLSEEGKKATVFRLRQGDSCVLSMACLFKDIEFDVYVEAETECNAIIIPVLIFESLSKKNIYVENFSYKIITERFSSIMKATWQLLFYTLEQRIEAFLLDEFYFSKEGKIQITKELLSENIGSAREAVSRGLKKLMDKGLIEVGRGYIKIIDIERIKKDINY